MASKKEELRRLMRERQAQKDGKKIESPIAKYDNQGRLSCIICNIIINSEALWASHLIDKSHKDKLDVIKRSKQGASEPKHPIMSKSLPSTSKAITLKPVNPLTRPSAMKKPIDDDEGNVPAKKVRFDVSKIQVDEADLFAKKLKAKEAQKKAAEEIEIEPMETIEEEVADSTKLPAGFFDDPVQDAKHRNVVYKDPLDEEYAKFKKVIQEESVISEKFKDEELEEIQIDRELDEIGEQISIWARVNELEKQAEQIKTRQKKGSIEDESDDDVDLTDIDCFSNWRSKGTIKNK